MLVNLIHPPSFFHVLTAFKSTHTVKTDRNIINFLTKHFLTFKQFYLRAFRCVQSLSVECFDDLLSLKIQCHFEKQFCRLLKIIRQNDDSDRRLERTTRNCSANISSLTRKPLFEVQFLMTCDIYLQRGNYREIGVHLDQSEHEKFNSYLQNCTNRQQISCDATRPSSLGKKTMLIPRFSIQF